MTVNGNARLALGEMLAKRQMTVADLVRRIRQDGSRFDTKTIYKMAGHQPVRSLNLPILAAVGRALKLSDPSQLIVWPSASDGAPRLHRIDAATQTRLDELMSKNTEGKLNSTEHEEFEKLGRIVEQLSLENARLLAGHVATASAPKKSMRSRRRRSTKSPRPTRDH